VAQRVGRGIALLFHDRGTRRGLVVSSTPRPHFTPGKDPVPTLVHIIILTRTFHMVTDRSRCVDFCLVNKRTHNLCFP